MMVIKIKYLGWIVDLTKKKSEEMNIDDNATVGDLINLLVKKYGPEVIERLVSSDGNSLQPYVFFMVEGIRMERMNEYLVKALTENNIHQKKEISIMVIPALSGG